MDDTISRLAVIQIIEKMRARIGHNLERAVGGAIIEILDEVGENVGKLPSALGTNLAEVGTDCISRQSAIDAFNTNLNELVVGGEENAKTVENYLNRVLDKIKCLPSVQLDTYWKEQCQSYEQTINKLRESLSTQPEIKQQAINSSDCIDRRAALDALRVMQTYKLFAGDDMLLIDQAGAQTELMLLPSAQPEVVRCKDCKYGILDNNFPHQRFCKFKGDEWNNDDYFCGHAKKREVTT